MTALSTRLNDAKAYRHTLAKKLKTQNILTRNKITKLLVKKTPKEVLEEHKKTPEYVESQQIIREQHQKNKAEIARKEAEIAKQERIKEAKRGLGERVMYYSKDEKIPLKEIKEDFYGKFIRGDKSFKVTELIDNKYVLKHIDDFSEEEKELLVEIAGSVGERGLKLLSLSAKQGDKIAEGYINTILLTVVKRINDLEPKDNSNGRGVDYYPISRIKEEVEKVTDEGCFEYLEKHIKNTKHEGFVILSLAAGGVVPTEEQIKKFDRYRDFHNSIVEKLLENKKFKEAFLLNAKNTEYSWDFDSMQHNYKKLTNNRKLSDDEFIKFLVEQDCGPIILEDVLPLKLKLKPEQESKLIEQMVLLKPEALHGETLERASLLYPGLIGKKVDVGKKTLSAEDKKLLSLQDLRLLASKDTEDKELFAILRQEDKLEDKLNYLLDHGYFSAAVHIFTDSKYTKKDLSGETIEKLLHTIIEWKTNPFPINAFSMDRQPAILGTWHSHVYRRLPYKVLTFFKCVNQLSNQQLSSIKHLLNRVIMENNFSGAFGVDVGASDFEVKESGFLVSYLSPLIRGRFISEESLEKLRSDSDTGSNAINHVLQNGVLFEEWNPIANPNPKNRAWKSLWGRLKNTSLNNEAKKFVVDNIQITTTKNYRGEEIPALIIFGKKISFLTCQTQNSDICYEKDGRYYINKDRAQEIAKNQGKKLLGSIDIPALYGDNFNVRVGGTNLDPDDIEDLLGEFYPYCTVNYIIEGKTKNYHKSLEGEQFLPIVVCE